MNPIRVAGADDKTLYRPPTDRALIDVAGLNEQRGQSGAAGVRARSEFQVVLPVLAKRGFGGNADAYGFLTAAFGAGAMIGGLVVAGRRTPRRRAVVVAAAAFRATMLAATLVPRSGCPALPHAGTAHHAVDARRHHRIGC